MLLFFLRKIFFRNDKMKTEREGENVNERLLGRYCTGEDSVT